jgi:hypothetical protein
LDVIDFDGTLSSREERRLPMNPLQRRGLLVWLFTMFLILPAWSAAQTKPPANWTTKDLKEAISSAKTPQDHQRIAQYYNTDADRLAAEAKDHAELAEIYRKSPNLHEQKHPMSPQTAAHCQWEADRYTEMAQKQREMAKMHDDMAKSLSQ